MDKNILLKLHPLEREFIKFALDKNNDKNNKSKDKLNEFELSETAKELNQAEIAILRVFQWLEAKKIGQISRSYEKYYHMLKESYDSLVLKTLIERERRKDKSSKEDNPGISISELSNLTKINKNEIGGIIGALKKELLIEFRDKKIRIRDLKRAEKHIDMINKLLEKLKQNDVKESELRDLDKKIAEDLVKRRVLSKITKERIVFRFNSLDEFKEFDLDLLEHNSKDVIKSGIWKQKRFRAYDINAKAGNYSISRIHFVTQAIRYIRQIWIEMGFKEMDGSYIQSSFWDLDSLFVPQDHPARTMQDSFYINETADLDDYKDIIKKVKVVHTGKAINTKGWNKNWEIQEASKVMLRTHTTALSAHKLSEKKKGRYFTIGKVFRNETLDWKHLFEFNQVEGIVVDENANFKQLIWYLRRFYKKMGYDDIRIRPAYFPYTEPSLEIEVFNSKKNEWIELGGAGIFRPEVSYALFGKEIPVLAWGLGLARIIVKPFKITDLRDLYGNDLKKIEDSPLIFFR